MHSKGNISIQGSNPYIAFMNSDGTTKGYIQYVQTSDYYAFGANATNGL
jgi:hypothetical protein